MGSLEHRHRWWTCDSTKPHCNWAASKSTFAWYSAWEFFVLCWQSMKLGTFMWIGRAWCVKNDLFENQNLASGYVPLGCFWHIGLACLLPDHDGISLNRRTVFPPCGWKRRTSVHFGGFGLVWFFVSARCKTVHSGDYIELLLDLEFK